MKFRWRVLLPLYGLLLFGVGTYASMRVNQEFHNGAGRYFWWSALRLDSDPLNKHPLTPTSISCPDRTGTCLSVDPVGTWVDPGLLAKCFMLSTLPAWLATKGIVRGFARLGVSEITSFFVSMPLLSVAWCYFVGWALDHRKIKCVRT
jgi:hypothetical protein